MTSPLINVSVVVCTYTEARWDFLVEAIDSLKHQTKPPRECIVVIDHNQSLFERVRVEMADVVTVENQEARGLSGARNSGIAVARGEIIAFLDDDAIAAPDWLERLVQYCENPQVLGAGGSVLPIWDYNQPTWFPEEFYWVIGCSYYGLPRVAAPVRNLFGGCMCIRREVFEVVGGFRTGIGRSDTRPMGCEETELCIRAHQHWPGRIFMYEPAAWISHHVPKNRASLVYFLSRCYAEGRSKALVSQLVGMKDTLASERTYTVRALPQGLVRGLQTTFLRGNPVGMLKVGAIVIGLAYTTVGFLWGTLVGLVKKPHFLN